VLLFSMALPTLMLGLWIGSVRGGKLGPAPVGSPTFSTPLALTHDDRFLWVTNPNNNSVTLMEVANDANRKIKEIRVGQEPRSVAITPDDKKVYVANQVSGTVSVIDAVQQRVVRVIPVGTEPDGCALTPDGRRLFVANFNSDNLSVIDTATDKVIETIGGVGPKPRGIAITTDANGVNKIYVTQFLAQIRDDGRTIDQKEGRDDGKEGRVTLIVDGSPRIIKTIVLNPIADTGFLSNGSTLDRVGLRNDANGQPIFDTVTGAFPNLLHSVVIKGNNAYVPALGSSPNGPFRFNVNVQSLLSRIDAVNDVEVSADTINMNKGVQFEPVGKKIFNTSPFAIAFKHNSNEGFVALGGIDRLVRVTLDEDGSPSINPPLNAQDPGNIVRVLVGKNPRGVVINSTDTRAYVFNYITRDVSAVKIDGDPSGYTEIARISSAELPTPGSLAAIIHRGEELFVTSIGPEGTQENALFPAGRMSDFGWGNCYNCHPDGLHDGVTWMFPGGPRQTISMENTGEHPQPAGAQINANGAPVLPSFKQRVLNWAAVRIEVQAFELNTRAVSGGQGLIQNADGSVDPCVFNLIVPPGNPCPPETGILTGRSADFDAIAAYSTMGIRAPISPLSPRNVGGGAVVDPDVIAGRALFAAANCQSCHGGPNWTRSRVDFAPPPLAAQIVGGSIAAALFPVGTFDVNAFNEVQPNLAAVPPAVGAAGFNIPSLRSVFAGAPYLHSGQAPTLDDVLLNVTHRSAGTAGVDTLSNPADRAKLAKFVRSIDAKTPIFP
jgi:YVTN family beta-propeller protein